MPQSFRFAPWLLLIAGLSIAILSGCSGKKKKPIDTDSDDDGTTRFGRSMTTAPGMPFPKGKFEEPVFKKKDDGPDRFFLPDNPGPINEDPEVQAYIKKRGWSLRRDVWNDDRKWLICLTVENKDNSFADVELTDEDAQMIGKAKSVQVLALQHVKKCTDAQLKLALTAPKLEGIMIASEELTDAALKNLVQTKGLQSIALIGTKKITDAGIQELAALPKLQTLYLSLLDLSGTGFEAFANVKSLESVTLQYSEGLTDDGVKAIAKIPNLHEFKVVSGVLGKDKFTRAGIQAIVDRPRLPEKLEFDQRLIDDELLVALVQKGWIYGPSVPGKRSDKPATAEEVKYLSLDNCKITDKGFASLLNCVNVTSIYANSTGIGDESLKKLSSFKKLNSLSIGKTNVTAIGLEAITACPIKNLSLENQVLTEDCFKAFAKINTLEELGIAETKMKPEWLKHLTGLTKLKELNLRNAECDDEAAKSIAGMTSLESITLNSTKIGDVGFQELLKLPKLRSLFVDGTNITKEVYQKAKKDHPKLSLYYYRFDQ